MEIYKGIFKLMEEMSELNVELAKLGPFPEGKHPDGKGDLKERVENEMADVQAALHYFASVNDLTIDHQRYVGKLKKFQRWGLTGISVPDSPDVVYD